MPPLNPQQFVDKWSRIGVKEIASIPSHFNGVCELIDHSKSLERNPEASPSPSRPARKRPTASAAKRMCSTKGDSSGSTRGSRLTNLYTALVHYRDNVPGKTHNADQWKRDVQGIITLDAIDELDSIHRELDQAVLDAYGWPHALTDEEILERPLALNLERAAV